MRVLAIRNARTEFVCGDGQVERLARDLSLLVNSEVTDQAEPAAQVISDRRAAAIHIKRRAADHDVRAHPAVAAEDFPFRRVLRLRGRSRAQRERRKEYRQQNMCASHRRLPRKPAIETIIL